MVQNNIRNVEMVCSINVIKQTFLWNSSINVVDACSRKILELLEYSEIIQTLF